MILYAIAYIIAAVVFLAIDALWLGVVIKSFIQEQLGPLLRERPDFLIAALFYMVYVGGIVFFAVKPALMQESVLIAVLYGALFGFFCYGTYEFTNLATLKGWSAKFAVVDLLWGTFLTGFSAGIGYLGTHAVNSFFFK